MLMVMHGREKAKTVSPVILSVIAPVSHLSPRNPRPDWVPGRIPDLLAPDDVLEVEQPTVLHHPFGHDTAVLCSDLSHEKAPIVSIGWSSGPGDQCRSLTPAAEEHM